MKDFNDKMLSHFNDKMLSHCKDIEAWTIDICRNHVNPNIKGDITAGKIKWRGLRVVISRDDTSIYQRGEAVGYSFSKFESRKIIKECIAKIISL